MKELQKCVIVWFLCICVFCKNELEFDIFESTIPAKNVTEPSGLKFNPKLRDGSCTLVHHCW